MIREIDDQGAVAYEYIAVCADRTPERSGFSGFTFSSLRAAERERTILDEDADYEEDCRPHRIYRRAWTPSEWEPVEVQS